MLHLKTTFHRALVLALSGMLLAAGTARAESDTFGLGNGHNGALTVNAANTVINTYARVTANVPANQNFVTVTSTTGFAVSDLVLIHQTTGYTGTVTSGSQVVLDASADAIGRFQLVRVQSLTATRLTFTSALTIPFTTGGTQAIRVPEYSTVTVNAGGSIVAGNWTGTTGGIVVFFATAAVNNAGALSASGAGFRGGGYNNGDGDGCTGIDQAFPGGANKGEGIVPARFSTSIPPSAGTTGYGNILNAGGGGICHNSGGGGGGNGGGGGKGGRTWSGDTIPSRDVGGLGGVKVTFSPTTRLLFGGGGGSGHGNDDVGSGGANGGGLVFIRAASISGAGLISANGIAADGSSGEGNDAAGGGGAGGVVVLRTSGALSCSGNSVTARGGSGGSTLFADPHAPGGGGGGGQVFLQGATVTCSPVVTGGLAGTQPTATAPDGSTYGAIAGNPGVITTVSSPFVQPSAPTVVTPANGSTTGTNPPYTGTTSGGGSQVVVKVDGLEVSRVTSDAAGNWTYTPSTALSVGAHTISALVDDYGYASSISNTNTFTVSVDTTPPDTTIVSGPPALANSTTAPFKFNSNESPVTYECSLDGGAYAACTATVSFTVGQGNHTLSVRAVDAASNVDPTPESYAWAVDSNAPDTTIVSGPAAVANSTTATFSFSSDESPVTYKCSLDSAAYTPCAATVSFTVGQNNHTLSVRAIDGTGNVDPTPATYSWTVDSIAPDTTIVTGPAALTNSTAATFSFSSNDSPVTFECNFDNSIYAPCSAAESFTVGQGEHTLAVRAVDAIGNADSTPATYTWLVDSIAPDTTIVSGPPALANSTTAAFTFSSNESPVTFACSLDSGTYAPCTASFTAGQGDHTLAVRTTDSAGNVDATPATYSWSVDTVVPDTTIASKPGALTNSTSVAFTFSSNESPVTFACSLDSGAYASCTASVSFTVGQGGHTLSVRATDAAGNVDPTPATHTWTVDSIAPNTTIASKPSALTTSTTADFTFSSNESPITFECSLDSGAYASCAATKSFTVGQGDHTLAVRATDSAGNVDATPATYSWSVDSIAPDTTIASKPGALTNSTSAAFTFTSNESPVTFTCSLDSGAYASCTASASFAVGQGNHTLSVRATDAAGNVDTTPATHTWTVDSITPNTTIVSGPPALTKSTTAAFAFSSDESPVTFECSFDSGAYALCSTTESFTVGQGDHTFSVRAIDAAGNKDSTPATHTWTVDTIAPNTTIASKPTALTNSTTATFSFTSTKNPATFTCSLDEGASAPCEADTTFEHLADGPHKLIVTAVDAAGNVDSSPEIYEWDVDTAAPDTTIVSGPAALTNNTTATFSLTSGQSPVTFECSLDEALPLPCDAAAIFALLADGPHKLTVAAVDAAGNVDPTSVTYEWVVDTVAPDTTIEDAPTTLTNLNTATFTFTSNEPATFACSIDGGQFALCTLPTTITNISDGEHTFAVQAIDGAGNVDPSSATYTWTVDLTAPAAPIFTQPAALLASGLVTLAGTATGTSVTLVLDGTTHGPLPVANDGTWTFTVTTPLADGPYTASATTTDAASNTSAPATRTFTVDTQAPKTTITSAPQGTISSTEATFVFTASETATFACSVDSGAFAACTSPVTLTVADGPHTFRVQATDTAGNVEATPVEASWTVLLDNDADNDGLTDAEEAELHTNPNLADTDGDELSDFVEVRVAHTEPLDDDTDNDGLTDGNEDTDHDGIVDEGETDPLKADTDEDGLSDGLELGLAAPQGEDTDLDVFTADADTATRTDPLKADTDSGSVFDGIEDANHNGRVDEGETNPLVADDDKDADLDGIDDATEVAHNLNPHDADSDDDGVTDGLDGLNDTDGDGTIDALDADSDGDGLLDGTERGITLASAHKDTDTSSPNFLADEDPATTTDAKNADTDGDGFVDGKEDANHNGRVDEGETDPNVANRVTKRSGCGCNGGEGSFAFALLLVPLARRRRR